MMLHDKREKMLEFGNVCRWCETDGGSPCWWGRAGGNRRTALVG